MITKIIRQCHFRKYPTLSAAYHMAEPNHSMQAVNNNFKNILYDISKGGD